MFYIATNKGFVGHMRAISDIRQAKPFESKDEAEDYAEGVCRLQTYVVLRTC